MKLTPWFPADVKPVHVGVYEIFEKNRSDRPTFKLWNGKYWGLASSAIHHAACSGNLGESILQNERWRGLASPSTPSQKAEV